MTPQEMAYLTEKLGYEPDLKRVQYLRSMDATLDEIVEALELL